MDVTHALNRKDFISSLSKYYSMPSPYQRVLMGSYQNPTANTTMIMAFFFCGICNFQIVIIGSTRIEKSDMTLKIPVAIQAALPLKQCPSVISMFQILSRGMHMAISKTVSTR